LKTSEDLRTSLPCKNGVDGDGKCTMQELPASLEQVAFISYCVSPPCSLCSLVFLIGMHNLTSMAPPKAPCSQGCLLFIMPSHLHLATDAFSVLECIFFTCHTMPYHERIHTCHTMSALQPCSLEAGMPFGISDRYRSPMLFTDPDPAARPEDVHAKRRWMPSRKGCHLE